MKSYKIYLTKSATDAEKTATIWRRVNPDNKIKITYGYVFKRDYIPVIFHYSGYHCAVMSWKTDSVDAMQYEIKVNFRRAHP